MTRRRALLAGLLLLLPLMSGCLESKQVNQFGYVQSIGLDKGERKKYAYSFLMQQAAASNASASGEEQTGIVIGAEGDTLFEAVTTVIAGFPYELNFTRVDAVFFSQEIAQAGGIEEMLALSESALKIRHSAKYFVVLGKAMDFQKGLQLQSSPNLTQIQHSVEYNNRAEGTSPLINHALVYEAVITERFDPVVPLGGIDQSIEQASDKEGKNEDETEEQEKEKDKAGSTLGVPREGGMKSYVEGAALFDGPKMTGTLNGRETIYLLMARGELHKAYINYVDNTGKMFSVHITQEKKPRVDFFAGDTPCASVYIPLVCEIHMSQETRIYKVWEERLQKELTSYMERAVQGVFSTCKTLRCDALGFGRYASMQFRDHATWEAYNWKEKYARMQANFQVELLLHDAYEKSGME